MAKKLRKGLVEPTDIPSKDLPSYMADTYRGYIFSIKQRIEMIEANKSRRFGYREIDEEFFALQCRLIMELIAFMISTFHQSTTKPIGKSKRTGNDPIKIIQSINYDFSYLKPVDLDFQMDPKASEVLIPNIKFSLCDYETFKSTHGKLGAILHEQQRPRIEKRTLTLDEIFQILKELKLLVFKHIITDKQGNGWYVDTTMKDQPRGIGIVKLNI